MSRCVELPTAALTALTELSAVTKVEFDQLREDRIRQQLRTTRNLAISLNGLPPLPSISRQGTPAPLEQNPRFQQLQQRVQNLPNEREAPAEEREALAEEREALAEEREALAEEREALAEEREALAKERDALTKERDALLTEGQGLEARYRAIETDL